MMNDIFQRALGIASPWFIKSINFDENIKRPTSELFSVRMISPPWSGVVSSFTLLYEALLIQFCRAMPVHNVSQLTGVSDHKIWRVLDVYVNAAKFVEDLSDVTLLGMDETSVAKGHDYIALFGE